MSERSNGDVNLNKYIGPDLELHELKAIKKTFDSLDANRKKVVTSAQLKEQLKEISFNKKNPVLFQMLMDVEEEQLTDLTFDEFVQMMTVKLPDTSEKELKRVFYLIDTDGNGEISVENLNNLCNELGEDFNEGELLDIIEHADLDKDGKLSYDDFCEIMKRKVLG